MAFFKTATASVVGIYRKNSFNRIASAANEGHGRLARTAAKVLSPTKLRAIANIYNLSDNIDDYVFPVLRAVTADIPNDNGDRFTHQELTRFSPKHRCQVYETFRFDPYHVEHAASDPKTARGFLPDVRYNTDNHKDKHILCVAAIDTKKDPVLAEGILTGKLTDCSMGCVCEAVRCSACHHVAYNDDDLCDHLRFHMMATINGQLVFEDCLGVEFVELSQVSQGADRKAKVQTILDRYEQHRRSASFTPLASILSQDDCLEIATFVRNNLNILPDSMVKLVDKLF